MDLQEVIIEVAKLMKIEKDFYENHLKARRPHTKKDVEELLKLEKQYEIYKAHTRKFTNIIAADPRFFDVMESWIVCVEGKDPVSKSEMLKHQKTADVESLINSACNIAPYVKSYIRSLGYFIYDMGAGEDGWDLNIRCTDKDSKELCRSLHQKFFKAISHNLLIISRKFGEHRLPGLYTYQDAVLILQLYGDNIT